jgi:hypothetical protein
MLQMLQQRETLADTRSLTQATVGAKQAARDADYARIIKDLTPAGAKFELNHQLAERTRIKTELAEDPGNPNLLDDLTAVNGRIAKINDMEKVGRSESDLALLSGDKPTARKFATAAVGAMSTLDTTGNFLRNLQKDPTALTDLRSVGTQFANLRAEMTSLFELTASDNAKNEAQFATWLNNNESSRFTSGMNALQKSLIIDIAYANIKTKEGGRLSDQDFQRAAQIVGLGLKDPNILAEVMANAAYRGVVGVRNQAEALGQGGSKAMQALAAKENDFLEAFNIERPTDFGSLEIDLFGIPGDGAGVPEQGTGTAVLTDDDLRRELGLAE